MVRFPLLGVIMMSLSSCAVTFPTEYDAQGYTKLGDGSVRFGEFVYVPAVKGDLKSNEVKTKLVTPGMYLEEDVADFVKILTSLEFQQAGLTISEDANIEIRAQILEFSFLDSVFSTRWNFKVNYSMYNSGELVLNQIYESSKGGGLFVVSHKPISDIVGDAVEKFMSDVIDRKIFAKKEPYTAVNVITSELSNDTE